MMDRSWAVEEPDQTWSVSEQSQPSLVSLHFLRAALRRAWPLWVGLGLVGMLLGVAWTVVVPSSYVGTVTLLLAHEEGTDPNQAIATDVSLLRTRTLASTVVHRLHLDVSPDTFQSSVTATPATMSVLVLTVPAPDERAAVARATALSDSYLKFRAQQMESQSTALVNGYRRRIAALQQRADKLTAQYNAMSAQGPQAQSAATDVLTERAQILSQVNTLQQAMQDAALKSGTITTASHVLDPPSAVPPSQGRRQVLCAGSGLIGGMALGVALVLFTAVTSSRLRRREEVALALNAPVRVSVSGLGGGDPWRLRPGARSVSAREVQVLVRALESTISASGGRSQRLAVGTVENADVGEVVLASLVSQLTGRGQTVFVVDLSESGGAERAVRRALGRHSHEAAGFPAPEVFRPTRLPCLARGPLDMSSGEACDLPPDDPRHAAWESADVVLTLVEIDPAVGVEHLRTWADRVVLLVTAGRSTAERLRTTGELLRTAGLRLLFAMLVGADANDESLGLPESAELGTTEAVDSQVERGG